MCFFETEYDQEQDPDFIIRKDFINKNRNGYNDIKNYINNIDLQDSKKFSVTLVFEQLFSVYNIANVFGEITLKNHVISVIDNQFITNNKLYLLLKEYIRIYENFVIKKLL